MIFPSNVWGIQLVSSWLAYGGWSCIGFCALLNHSCCNPDSGKCYANLSRHSWQNSGHDGLLGAGFFPRVSGSLAGASALRVQGKGCLLHRSDEPYRPPRPYKVCLILYIFSWYQCGLNTQQLHVKSMNLGNNLTIIIPLLVLILNRLTKEIEMKFAICYYFRQFLLYEGRLVTHIMMKHLALLSTWLMR